MKRPALNAFVCLILASALAGEPVTSLAAPAGKGAAGKTAKPAGKSAKGDKTAKGDKPEDKSPYSSGTFAGLEFRSIGPAVFGGRCTDIAIHPSNKTTWYVAAASGGVWKTINAGTTWTPIFDGEGSYSIGCLALDPNDPLTLWVGSGENNSQRSVSYGDGVYKSIDGGKSFENMGLKGSEHIGKIVVDPRDSNTVFVAAQGPLWTTGGERGLYKTTDGGKTWAKVLEIDDNTGINEVQMNPKNPDVLYASAYQRHRRVWTLVDGGPGSGLHKSVDGGKTWKKLTNGLPSVEMGRIGLAISPVDPNTVYAIVEAQLGKGGIYRSQDAGANWEKMGDYMSTSPQYYNELVADPVNVDRVYSMDTFMMVTNDGGKSWSRVGEKNKHVDNHFLWIEPENTKHLIAGCDGGVYESFDRAATWHYKQNIPIAQFYRLAVDNALPFYNVYGGTQDNNTWGGPSRTINQHGIANQDWFVTVGGDGFFCAVDPTDPNISYSEAQHGELIRFDRKTGEQVDIQPQPAPGDDALHWNWDAPLIISPHSHTRLYFAAQRLFKSDDRGDSWTPISPDLTRQLDRNRLKVAGKVWSVDAVAKNGSTSFYGNIVALCESPKQPGLLYVGTDDGLIQVTANDGLAWTKSDTFAPVPEMTFVSDIEASHHDASVVYASFDGHKNADFKPWVMKSADRGRTWTNISGDLPERGTVYCLAEDPGDPNLLFAGTEFGVFFTKDGGTKWLQLKGGLPTIQVRDMAIQEREHDLVLATFGRGFYVLDNYLPLRQIAPAQLDGAGLTLPVRTAPLYVPATPLEGSEGDAFYKADNPPFGATFTWYLKDELKTKKKQRQEAEKKAIKAGQDVFYPTWDALKAEDQEEEPKVVLTVQDAAGQVVRRLSAGATAGLHRTTWDLRYPASVPASQLGRGDSEFDRGPAGPLVAPGSYTVSVATWSNGVSTPVGTPQTFEVKPLLSPTLPVRDPAALLAFQRKVARLQRAALGLNDLVSEASGRLAQLRKALKETPAADPNLDTRARALDLKLREVSIALNGDPVKARRNEATLPGILDRVLRVTGASWYATSDATGTQQKNYDLAAQAFAPVLAQARTLVDVELKQLEADAEAVGAPWTPGRVPNWQPE